MNSRQLKVAAALACISTLLAFSLTSCGGGGGDPVPLGDGPAMPGHVAQASLRPDGSDVEFLIERGRQLFEVQCNSLDGAGRPELTGTGAPRARRESPQNVNRISGPDANSCAGCHNLPRAGGGGDDVANVFVLGQRFGFVNFEQPPGEGDGGQSHTLEQVADERNTPGMFGAGFVELAAREMTTELQAIRAAAVAAAQSSAADVTRPLLTKGVSFGSITAHADASLDTSGVQGVDADLVVKPFHQKGAVVSIRVFTNNAFLHHHGMSSVERAGVGVDDDHDGVVDELSVGDVTAVTRLPGDAPRARPGAAPGTRAATGGGRRRGDVRVDRLRDVPRAVPPRRRPGVPRAGPVQPRRRPARRPTSPRPCGST